MKKKGFTLVELLAVIAILAILVIIALPNVLKMFNDSKKNSFLTEAKTLYSEVSKKYISENMKGNKLTYISSEDDTKLEMTGRDLQYCVLLNTDGSVKSMKVSNGEWIAELPSGKKITDLNSSDLIDGNLNDYDCYNPFRDDSWETIASNAKKCVEDSKLCPYNVGDEKEVDLGTTYGKHMVRIANLKAPTEEGCETEGFSKSACGFVVEFTDIITTHVMNPTNTNKGGWPGSQMKTFLDNDIYNSLPKELKSVIITTETVSGHGPKDTKPFESPEDKLYLLAPKEIYANWSDHDDTARDKTRQLDYYNSKGVTKNSKGVTKNSYASAIKKNSEGTAAWWWLRCAFSSDYGGFYSVNDYGAQGYSNADYSSGVSPAFRIG